ncbi:helix-turn-helix domain-containing protein [Metabacillus iocasae]|uniref:Schlafen AlbA-2 domain-containing protein n=1 Tax=Priestia iocasae TaxID=2291674 RepID=A0ABS2QVK4_9BACI|nr:ATP-binding protein [Metabacillus iocasae]MBM7702972.1 hypothetical protein [Metabacillus iocasae]
MSRNRPTIYIAEQYDRVEKGNRGRSEMIESFYSPFVTNSGRKKTIFEIKFADVEAMIENDTEEGYQLEFKREISSTVRRKIPNIIASFANEMGGWLIFGIDEDEKRIHLIERKDYELFINNMLKDVTNPVPRIVTRFLATDDDPNQGVLVIWIPEGNNPPYISYGKIYRRVGSGSSPVTEIEDRYHLDRLYQKSEDRMYKLEEFCTKELSIYNRKWPMHGKNYVHYGMCNIYIIPLYDLDLLQQMNIDMLKQHILTKSLEMKDYDLEGGFQVQANLPFLKASHSADSIIFRNNEMIDSYDKTIAWEQFFNGSAKFHIPIPYVDELDQVKKVLKQSVPNYVDEKIFEQFQYIDGHLFLTALLSCFGEYFDCITDLKAECDEMIVVIDLENVRNDVLYFHHEPFVSFLQSDGLVFSDKNKYRFNKSFLSTQLEMKQPGALLAYFDSVIHAFGLSQTDGIRFFIHQLLHEK